MVSFTVWKKNFLILTITMSSSRFALSHLATFKRRSSIIGIGSNPSLCRRSFGTSVVFARSNSNYEGEEYDSETKRRLSVLHKEIARLNGGNPINVRSPKQVSTAIFGKPQTATKSVLSNIATSRDGDDELSPEKRALAQLILESRSLLQNNKNTEAPSIETASNSVKSKQEKGFKRQITEDQLVESLFQGPNSKLDIYWLPHLLKLSKSTARTLLHQLDPDLCPMGYDPNAVPNRTTKRTVANTTAGKRGTFLSYCRSQKEKYPQCVILVRCGDFYETFGIDAIMLVEHLGLNSMAGKARAGCPYRNIQATINGLTQQGFSVAVYEEIGTASNSKKLKTRFLSQIVSPASPTYLYDNWLLGGGDHEHHHGSLEGLPPSRSCVGIVNTAAGYNMVEVSLEERSIKYSERLTAEAVACRLEAYPPADPLVYIPSTTEMSSSSSSIMKSNLPFLPQAIGGSNEFTETSLGGFRIRTNVLPPNLIPKEKSGISDADRYIQAIVEKLIDYNEVHDQRLDDTEISKSTKKHNRSQRTLVDDFTISMTSTSTNPLYVETASQLGLLQTPSIPPLVAFVLDEAAPAATKRFVQRYLLVPPPPEIAEAMATLVGSLMRPNASPLPPLMVPPLGKILSLVRAGQASANIYGDVLQCLSTAKLVLEEEQALPINSLLSLCEHESGLPCEKDSLVERCHETIDTIQGVVSPAFHIDNQQEEYLIDSVTTDLYVSDAFFERNESPWRGRVRPEVAEEAYQRVQNTSERFQEAIKSDYIGNDESNKALIGHDFHNNLIFIKNIPNGSLSKDDYIRPRDRFGKILSNRYTTAKVQNALSDYIAACEMACNSVSSILSNLAEQLQEEGHIPAIVQSVHLNLVLSVAYNHAVKSSRQNWNLANILDDSNDETTHIDGIWPYWMEHSEAVSNTFDLSGLFLLTAPNMSGKSTLMRSTAAATLLSICGFCAPLGVGSKIPRFDTLFLRGASADVPTEDKSAFGAEMGDIAALMRCCGPKSLIFVDELGRGTSPRDGTRLAGAVLEAMARKGMNGIFATHLHDILELPLEGQERIIKKRLAIEEKDGSYEWTYHLEDGVCVDSLALVTASRFGLPEDIIARAEELCEYLPEAGGQKREPKRKSKSIATNELDFQQAIAFAESLIGQSSVSIPPRWAPPPALCANQSCVYMIELQLDPPTFYVGETDSLSQRLKKHRGKGGPWSGSRTIAFPVGDKTEARAWESRLIQKMAQSGFRMESITDGRTLRHF